MDAPDQGKRVTVERAGRFEIGDCGCKSAFDRDPRSAFKRNHFVLKGRWLIDALSG